MRSDASSTRSPALNASATALMTLVALAATVSAAPAPNAAQIGCTAAVMEQTGVRGVAAAFAAAAREFFGAEHQAKPSPMSSTSPTAPDQPQVIEPCIAELPRIIPLGDHLMNLPPPAC